MPDTLSLTSIAQQAVEGACPKCGARTVFEAPAMVADQCHECGLKLSELEPSGRFVPLLLTVWVIVILICAALFLELQVRPPMWVHVILWAPLTIGLELFALRFYKVRGVTIAYEKRRTAYVQSGPQ